MSEAGGEADRPRIMLVEDEFLIRLTLAEALADEGYDVIEAASGEDALAALEADGGAIGLMLTDIQLPGPLDGRALAFRLRERQPGLPVIFMSGRPEALPDAGGAPQMMVAKPYLPSDICAAVQRLLAENG
jgi:DNA-binding response OmpR family regulator